MSLYSLIGIILMVVVLAAGIVVKLVLRRRREELDGCHGLVHKEEGVEDDEGWENLEE